jgi:hypothetical protein
MFTRYLNIIEAPVDMRPPVETLPKRAFHRRSHPRIHAPLRSQPLSGDELSDI